MYPQYGSIFYKEQPVTYMIDHHGSQHIPWVDPEDPHFATFSAPWPIKLMIGYLYFAQGFILSIAGTIPYTYPQLPDYITLSLFSLSVLPFSFKFLTAPILEKYSNLTYGKRKTWIITSQILTNLMVFVCSFFTRQNNAQVFAILCIFMYLGLSLQDISLDALCLKQLKNPKLMSTMQAGCQSTGVILGGLILLKATSQEFAEKIGRSEPIATMQQLMIGLSIFLLIPGILIHLRFAQTRVSAQQRATRQSIWKVYSIYRYYFKKQYRYCRVLIYLFIYHQGFNLFLAGYGYELIKRGFSRDTMNTIDNVQNVIITSLIFIVGTHVNFFGFAKTTVLYMGIFWSILLYLWIWFPIDVLPVIITNFLLGLLLQWDFLISTQLCAHFPETGATGMLYTMSASASNLGKNLFIHTAILKILPWKTISMIGLIIQIPLILLFVPKMIALIEKGETKIQYDQQQKAEFQIDHQLQIKNSEKIKNQSITGKQY